MMKSKVISFAEASDKFSRLHAQGKRIVQSHGTFDLLHPGHIIHFEEAAQLGDILVVTITGEKWVNKGPGRPYFNDELRIKSLVALEPVDYVIVVPHTTAMEAIQSIKPHVYCKGREYFDQSNDITGNINNEVKAVKQNNGEVKYIGSRVFSSTKLINNYFEHLPSKVKEYTKDLAETCPPEDFIRYVEEFSKLKVLVIGDLIFDQYAYVSIQGLTSKDQVLSGRFIDEEIQAGGALAIFRHLKRFCKDVKLISLVGTESWVDNLLANYITPRSQLLIRDPDFCTIVKKRYVESCDKEKEIHKLLSLNYMNITPPSKRVQELVRRRVAEEIRKYDLVVVSDFGHGLLEEELRDYIQKESKYLALNCQTNSHNYSFNVINKKYDRADCFTLDQQEISLACGSRDIDQHLELEALREKFRAEYAWLTRGPKETLGVQIKRKEHIECPSLETAVMDAIGAGDAFFSMVSLAAKIGLSLNLATFMGQLAGAQAIKIVGNAEPISKQKLLKGGVSLLNY